MVIVLVPAGGEGGIGFAVLRGFAPILADCLFGLKALTEPKGSHPSGEQKGSVGLAWLGKFIEPVPAGGEGGIGWPMAIASDARWAALLREDKPRSVELWGSHPSGE